MIQKANTYIRVPEDRNGIPANNPPRVFAICGDARDLKTSTTNPLISQVNKVMGGTARFDLIVSIATLKHFESSELPGLIVQWSKFLKPGGHMFLQIPSSPNINAYYTLSVSYTASTPLEGAAPYRYLLPYIMGRMISGQPHITWPMFISLAPSGVAEIIKESFRGTNWNQVYNCLKNLKAWDVFELIINTGRNELVNSDGFESLCKLMDAKNRPTAAGNSDFRKWVSWMDVMQTNKKFAEEVPKNLELCALGLAQHLWNRAQQDELPYKAKVTNHDQFLPGWWSDSASAFVLLKMK
jgi:SAM-dependent methyltransferase